jgi:hypothetical protein
VLPARFERDAVAQVRWRPMLDAHIPRLDVARAMRSIAAAGQATWAGAVLTWDAEREALVIDDDLRVELERVPARLPSGRWVPGGFVARCPRGCGQRARVLWWVRDGDEVFPVCRGCAGVTYASAAVSPGPDRDELRVVRARRRIGAAMCLGGHVPPKPPGMHNKTWDRLVGAVRAAEEAYEASLHRSVARAWGKEAVALFDRQRSENAKR